MPHGSASLPACRCSPWAQKRSEEHTSELQSQSNLVCRLLLEKKKKLEQHFRSLPRSRFDMTELSRPMTAFITLMLYLIYPYVRRHVAEAKHHPADHLVGVPTF